MLPVGFEPTMPEAPVLQTGGQPIIQRQREYYKSKALTLGRDRLLKSQLPTPLLMWYRRMVTADEVSLVSLRLRDVDMCWCLNPVQQCKHIVFTLSSAPCRIRTRDLGGRNSVLCPD